MLQRKHLFLLFLAACVAALGAALFAANPLFAQTEEVTAGDDDSADDDDDSAPADDDSAADDDDDDASPSDDDNDSADDDASPWYTYSKSSHSKHTGCAL